MNNPIDIAKTQLGVKEVMGYENNPQIVRYFQEIGATNITNDATAWCAAFVNWCLKKADKKYSSNLSARSFLNYGVETKEPQYGDIVVMWREKINSSYGHVAFYVSDAGDGKIECLGGNQDSSVKYKKYDKSSVLSYRRISRENESEKEEEKKVVYEKVTFLDRGDAVKKLQRKLISENLLREGLDTGFYYTETAKAVLMFQLKNKVDSEIKLRFLGGKYVGPKTLAVLNK